ncbi:MAG: hypothetical protein GEV00_21680, partial [Actinophytocola sp.]|nr:hypothetical protein [Actinophytocola sp.]
PVAVLKIGRSDAGRRAAVTHTAALAGADEVVDAALEECGVIRVFDVDELVDLARIVERYGVRPVSNVGVCSLSGGSAALLADLAGVHGLGVEPPTEATLEQLREILPPLAAVGNPVDLTTEIFGIPETAGTALGTFLGDAGIDAAVFPFPYQLGRINHVMAEELVVVAEHSDKPVVAVGLSESLLDDQATRTLRAAGVPYIPSATKAVLALERYARLGRHLARPVLAPMAPAEEAAAADRTARDRVAALLEDASGPLSEQQSEEMLRCYGVDFAASEVVDTVGDAVAAAERLGYPVVLKSAGADVAHKSDAGLVRVGLWDPAEVRTAFEEVSGQYRQITGRERAPVKVAELVDDGLEVLCGVTTDPSFGPVVTFGVGGVYAEILGDLAMRVCPIDVDQARCLVTDSRCSPILNGARGGPVLDVDALAGCLAALSRFAHDWSDRVDGVDINPLKVRAAGRGVVGLDALVALSEH